MSILEDVTKIDVIFEKRMSKMEERLDLSIAALQLQIKKIKEQKMPRAQEYIEETHTLHQLSNRLNKLRLKNVLWPNNRKEKVKSPKTKKVFKNDKK